ncbi:uncharacterized protein isoform X1 [Macaca fascicularis]|uniref:uncharacterized protein isoform X1 n=1 Tax=Macaca fascicularis TaxID=9541 RepID=UPI0032B03813
MLLSEELGSARGYGAYSNTSRCCCDSQGLGLHMVMRGGGLGEAQTGGEGRMGVRAGWEGAPALRARLPGWDRAPGPAAAAAAAATLPTLFPNTHRASEPPSHGPSGRRKEPVCVLRPCCDSGSCLSAGASVPAQLDLGGSISWRREIK